MKCYDFEYDGLYLSDFGYIICNFNGSEVNTVSNGSQIEFHTLSVLNGMKQELLSTEYNECLTANIQICKNPCMGNNLEITLNDLKDLTNWLNRKGFYKFKLLDDEYYDLFFEASFNINRIEIDNKIYGLELVMKTNRPFALQEPQSIVIKNSTFGGEKSFYDTSYEEGFIYPYTEIIIEQDGDLSIINGLENRITLIKNCVAGEVITMEYPIIESSNPSHKIQNDFNWNFLRIANTFKNRKNDLTISIPCTIKMTYSPIVKVGV